MRWLLWILLALPALAQEPWQQPVSVPAGVLYQKASEEANRAAVERLRTVLAPGYQGPERLFGEVMFCGPFLWDSLRERPVAQGEGPVTKFEPWGVEGKAFKGGPATRALEAELRSMVSAGCTIRRPSPDELALYKSLVPYSIDEPIFLVENPQHKLLAHFHKGYVFALDDYQEASWSRLDELEARQPAWPLVTDYPGSYLAYREGQPVTERGPFTILLLTPEPALSRRVGLVPLGEYIKRLQPQLQLGPEPRDLVVQVELAPERAVTVTLLARPATDTEPLRRALAAVEPPYVKGRVVLQLLVRLNGGTGQPLGP